MRTAAILAALVVVVAGPAGAEPMLQHSDVFISGQDGYFAYRIPAVEAAPDGSLVALAEARKYNLADPGFGKQEIDLVLKRSTDSGATWSAMKVIEHAGDFWSAANPATVVDRQTGKLWVFYLRCKPGKNTATARPGTDDVQVLARWSQDNGLTWSEPVDLTAVSRDMADAQWRCSVPGPGGPIQDRNGALIAPVWKVAPSRNLVVFSSDHGQTWQRGQVVPGKQDGDENQLVELSDGRLLMDIRQSRGPHRWLAESKDGGRTWSEPRPGVTVTPVACAIERYTLRSAGDDRDRILWTGPKGPGRANLEIRVSYDEGQTFDHARPIAESKAAYSDLTILKDRTVGILWERGVKKHAYEFITFTRLNGEFLEPAR